MADALGQCCAMQKAYGRQVGDLETMVLGFCEILGEYELAKVKEGFKQFIRRNSTIPAPADIINIIDPLPPMLDSAFYRSLLNHKKNNSLTYEQRKFINAYEEAQLKKIGL